MCVECVVCADVCGVCVVCADVCGVSLCADVCGVWYNINVV